MQREIYLDNSATTALCPEAVAAMREAMEAYGNPSSLHSAGQAARALVERARAQTAAAFRLRSGRADEICFTASGTEASATAIHGAIYAKARRIGRRVITTDCEHPSVETAMRRLEEDGMEVVRIPTVGGVLDTERAIRALSEPTALVSMMLVNNETGAVFDVGTVFAAAKERDPRTVTHCDAVQAFLKVPFSPDSLRADLISVSSHKIHGPKGTGALYIRSDLIQSKRIVPLYTGGGQERGMRPGTENVIGICGFGAAAEAGRRTFEENVAHMTELRDALQARLGEMGVRVNVPRGRRAPHLLSLTLPDIRSETMLNALSADGICVSSGSACSSHRSDVNPSLTAFGLTAEEAGCVIRVSLSRMNDLSDIDALCDSLRANLERLVRVRR